MYYDKEMLKEISTELGLVGKWNDEAGFFFIDSTTEAERLANLGPVLHPWNPLLRIKDALSLMFRIGHMNLDITEAGILATYDKKGEELVHYYSEMNKTLPADLAYESAMMRAITTAYYYHLCSKRESRNVA
jgi:hypothetical protein